MDQALAERRARIANATRVAKRTGDRSALDALRRDYFADKLEAAAREVYEQAPPLTEAQRARIAAALVGGHSG